MVSKAEQKIREMDNPELSIREASRSIAEKIGISEEVIKHYISASRNGETYLERVTRQALARLNPETGTNYSSLTEYWNGIAKRRGFESHIDYTNWRRHVKKALIVSPELARELKRDKSRENRHRVKEILAIITKQEKSLEHDLVSLAEMDRMPSEMLSYREIEEREDYLEKAKSRLIEIMGSLEPYQRKTIELFFYDGKSLEEISKTRKTPVTREAIRTSKLRTLKEMYRRGLQIDLPKIYEEL